MPRRNVGKQRGRLASSKRTAPERRFGSKLERCSCRRRWHRRSAGRAGTRRRRARCRSRRKPRRALPRRWDAGSSSGWCQRRHPACLEGQHVAGIIGGTPLRSSVRGVRRPSPARQMRSRATPRRGRAQQADHTLDADAAAGMGRLVPSSVLAQLGAQLAQPLADLAGAATMVEVCAAATVAAVARRTARKNYNFIFPHSRHREGSRCRAICA
jgi:hypothetical protein